jgi:hypothetical protein
LVNLERDTIGTGDNSAAGYFNQPHALPSQAVCGFSDFQKSHVGETDSLFDKLKGV